MREAQLPEPSGMSSTGELIDTEKVTISSEGRRWKSACKSNSLASYPTSYTVRWGVTRSPSSSKEARSLPNPFKNRPFENRELQYFEVFFEEFSLGTS